MANCGSRPQEGIQFTRLHFYHPALMYEEIFEFETLTFQNIISGVGGPALLFLALSLLTGVGLAGLLGFYLGASMLSLAKLLVRGVGDLRGLASRRRGQAPISAQAKDNGTVSHT